MEQIFENEYVSVADTFLLPLTGLKKDLKIKPKSYMFWNEYSIKDYKLILMFEYEDAKEMTEYLTESIFPILDSGGYLVENYDIEGRCILILDMSVWAFDIEFCLDGKYSKLSREAKTTINNYHFGDGNPSFIMYCTFNPSKAVAKLGNKTCIEYVAENYGLNLELLQKVGELGIKYVKLSETLLTDIDEITKV